jgi:AhpD family alkylhydroperoxidase
MESRIQLDLVEPNSYKAMFALEKYLQQSDLKKTHKELIKIRASQINGCAFCINMHTKEAIENGETPQRIFLLNAWRETNLFTKEERILLEITEEITLIHKKGLTTETYEKALTVFNQNYFSQIIIAITTINAWNRISISTNKPIEN